MKGKKKVEKSKTHLRELREHFIAGKVHSLHASGVVYIIIEMNR
jgi:hypothetical protein